MATAPTQLTPQLNIIGKTVAQYPNAGVRPGPLASALNATLYTTPSILGQNTMSPLTYAESNRYRITAYVTLVQASSIAVSAIGPLTITWNDGNFARSTTIGYNGKDELSGGGLSNPMTGKMPGQVGSVFAGSRMIVAAPGTAITISIPYKGNGKYIPNIALETY